MEMNMSKQNGGAAFPDPGRAQSAKQREQLTETGMTLLEYFIAHAPITWTDAQKVVQAQAKDNVTTYGDVINMLVTLRIGYADALLGKRVVDGDPETALREQLVTALRDCVSVMDRELNGLAVIQLELRQARAALAAAGAA
jgi:hypothetical protein